MRNKVYICLISLLTATLTSCGGGGGGNNDDTSTPTTPENRLSYEECLLKPFSTISPDAPKITLKGSSTVYLNTADTYEELGATAMDPQDGDISSKILIDNDMTQHKAGDYIISYKAKDADNNPAQTVYRIVRVSDEKPNALSRRPFANHDAPAGYLEHLPTFYGKTEGERYPLIIYAHGWEHFVDQSPKEDRTSTLMVGANMYRIFQNNSWPDSRPFIALEPQRCKEIGDDEWKLVDKFIQWAKTVYPIDESRIYLTGLSAGGYFTYRYPVLFPNQMAAIAPMSAGGPVSNSLEISNFCEAMANLPIWAFHGDADPVVPMSDSLYTFSILKGCPKPQVPAPKLTIVQNGGHTISNQIWDDSTIGQYSPNYSPYNQSLYDWFLQYTLEKK